MSKEGDTKNFQFVVGLFAESQDRGLQFDYYTECVDSDNKELSSYIERELSKFLDSLSCKLSKMKIKE